MTTQASSIHGNHCGMVAGAWGWPSITQQYPNPPDAPVQVQAPRQRSYHIQGFYDYASVQLEMEEGSPQTLLQETPFHLADRCKSSDLVFPQKLHMLLTASEQDCELGSIVSWKVHGRAFAVHDRKRFLKDVLPKWFLQSRFESFQRQLNLYGFRRITTGPDRGSCYHEMFLRQKPLLAARIQRLRLKGKGPRQPAKPELEPNFYRMTLLPTYGVAKNQTSYAMGCPGATVVPPSHRFLSQMPSQQPRSRSVLPGMSPPPLSSAVDRLSSGLGTLLMRSLDSPQAGHTADLPQAPKSRESERVSDYNPAEPSAISNSPSPVAMDLSSAPASFCLPLITPAVAVALSKPSKRAPGVLLPVSLAVGETPMEGPQVESEDRRFSIEAREADNVALAAMQSGQGNLEEASDEDFALILAELASGNYSS